MTSMAVAVDDLPAGAQEILALVVDTARAGFGPALRSVVLFGSGADGKLRSTSDLNVIFVLSAFEREAVDGVRESLRVAQAAVRLAPMFLLESELAPAAEAFAAKFADVRRRRRVLYGDDPFAALEIPRAAEIARLRQSLLNLTLRLRAEYALKSLREEQAALAVADAAGPLRASAASLVELEGAPAPSAKDALVRVAAELRVPGAAGAVAQLSEARETRHLPPGSAGPALFALLSLADALRRRAERLA